MPPEAAARNAAAEFDVVVGGAGGASLAAAITVAEAGRSVVLLEKNAKAGGSTAWSIGSITATGTPHQRRMGIEDSPEDHWADMALFAPRSPTATTMHSAGFSAKIYPGPPGGCGVRILNGDLALGPELRFVAPAGRKLVQRLPPWPARRTFCRRRRLTCGRPSQSSVTGEVMTRKTSCPKPVLWNACSMSGGMKMTSCPRTTRFSSPYSNSPSPSRT